MTYNEFMIESLTKQLHQGETLLHPIAARQETLGGLENVFLGFTEKFLLILRFSGKTIVSSERRPLDIKSVKINKQFMSDEYKINICFSKDAPLVFYAALKPLAYKTQKKNLPEFIHFLEKKSSDKNGIDLKSIDGIKIRRQYFNVILIDLLMMIPTVYLFIAVSELISDGKISADFWTDTAIITPVIAAMALPFVILSLLNRYVFGKLVAVINKEGIYLENYLLPWNKIEQVHYIPHGRSRRSEMRKLYTRAVFAVKNDFGKDFDIKVNFFPLYAYFKIKKLHPEIKSKLDKADIVIFALVPIVAILVFVIEMFAKR